MCGIVGFTGDGPALPVLMDGLSRLDYRGYDSAGVSLDAGGRLWRRRRSGRLAALAEAVGDAPPAFAGIAHTRWATHGPPTEDNAHPHTDCTGRIALVHNGIIENHRELRMKLEAAGHRFTSETDSEVLAHLLEEHVDRGRTLTEAVVAVVPSLDGSFAFAVITPDTPGVLIAARRGSPLVVGRTDTAGLIASDMPALLPYVTHAYAVEDDHVVEVGPGSARVVWPPGASLRRERRGTGWDADASRLGDYPDHMLKEIHQQPAAIAATLGGRRHDDVQPPPPALVAEPPGRIVIVGCGTSFHAGLAARPAFEAWARIPVECEIASEYRYRDAIADPASLVVGVSQSGETIDTLYALRQARAQGARVLALTNVAGSAIAREASDVLHTRAGPEIGVAATKTHVTQVVALQKLALDLARARGTLSDPDADDLALGFAELPSRVACVLARSEHLTSVAERWADRRDFFFLGRGPGYAVALEGALKLKEIAYVRAEAYAAGEMKHGPIALLEPGVVVVAIVGTGRLRAKMLSNIAEMRARGAAVVLVASDGDEEAAEAADDVLPVPTPEPGQELLTPAIDVIALQLFAYAIAKARGRDVDKPRNLAKTVTVE
jgi:glutamine---fructose-6-phosphate transaminase (isomerizing)